MNSLDSRKLREEFGRSFEQPEEGSSVFPMSQRRYQNETRDLNNSLADPRNQSNEHRREFRDPRSLNSEHTDNSEIARQRAQQKFIKEFDREPTVKPSRNQPNKNELYRLQQHFNRYMGDERQAHPAI